MTLFAWAHQLDADAAIEAASAFPRLGLVLNGGNYSAVERLRGKAIAYVGNERQAQVAAMWGGWAAAIYLDERNCIGDDCPSGPRLEPEEYADTFLPVYDVLHRAGIKVHTMGLYPVGGTCRQLTWRLRFDDDYHRRLPKADGRAWNPNKTRLAEIENTLDTHEGPWILSPAPFRNLVDRIREPVSVRTWAKIAERSDVLGVAFWCLQEIEGQPQHGLLDRGGNLTIVGKQVLEAL